MSFVDLWSDYRAIGTRYVTRGASSRLLPSALRSAASRPNLAEAAKRYAELGRRLHAHETSTAYAALCHQMSARCHAQAQTPAAECAELKSAADLFMRLAVDDDHAHVAALPQALTSALHCYAHATRCHVQAGQFSLAAMLCMQVATTLLITLDHGDEDEALNWAQQAVRYADGDVSMRANALQLLALAQL